MVLLDAFDECVLQDDEQWSIVDMVKELCHLGIRVWITTRHHLRSYLEAELECAIFKKIEAHEDDVNLFVTKRLESKKVPNDVKDEITRTICTQAKGM